MDFAEPAALAFAITIVLTLCLRPLAFRVALTDKPGGRKHHVGEIPLVGGIAMFIGMIIGSAFAADTITGLWSLIIPATMLVVVGVIDDRSGISATLRLATQAGAALIMMVGGGLYLRDIGDPFGTGIVGLGQFALPLSLLVAMSVINAFNFIDGIDGLAASMALIALGACALVSGIAAPTTTLQAIAFAAVLGFLIINVTPFRNGRIRTFMGDAGSTLLGFLVVWFTVSISQGDGRALSPVPALWFALVPLSDFFSCFFRRIAKGKLPLAAGREHLHYILLRAGMTSWQVLLVLVGFGIVYAIIGLVAFYWQLPDWPLFAAWMLLLCLQHKIIKRIGALYRHHRLRAREAAAAGIPAGARPRIA